MLLLSFVAVFSVAIFSTGEADSNDVSSEVNLALGRPATQSSSWADVVGGGLLEAGRAVDGGHQNDHSKSTKESPFSCSHTSDRPGGANWWRVQLDRPYRVEKVIVTTRDECCADRLDYFIVGVTNSTEDPVRGTYPLCGQYPSKASQGAKLTLNCYPNTVAGQYVIIQQPRDGPGKLTLCEVEVYAREDDYIVSPEVNLALGRPATQSSSWPDVVGDGVLEASRAVDGGRQNDHSKSTKESPFSCSHTGDMPGGPNWWRVQLDRPYRVEKVIVTNRKDDQADRLDYFIVGVTNSTEDPVRGTYPLCGQYPSTVPLDATVTLNCYPNTVAGQYVIIQQPKDGPGKLTLCEVEVYARADDY